MSKRKDVIHKAILRSNSHKVVKLPKEIIEELGWKISENVNIIISNVFDHNNDKWQEVQITREIDEDKVYEIEYMERGQ
tara:strand:- start:758 stop:994 length:237 start_codon:yes stop_codon:yes gene_type:complete